MGWTGVMSFFTTFSFPYMLNSSLGGQGCFWIYSVVSFAGKDIHILIPDDKELRLAQVNQSVSNIRFCHQHKCPQLQVILRAKCLTLCNLLLVVGTPWTFTSQKCLITRLYLHRQRRPWDQRQDWSSDFNALPKGFELFFELPFYIVVNSISESGMQRPQGKPSNANPKKRP